MSMSPGQYDAFIAQCAHQDPETLRDALDVQRGLTEGLLTIAQYETDDPEKREILDELEENAREFGLIGSDEDECSCNCSCSSGSDSDLPALDDLIETETNDADEPDADAADPELDPETPGKILNAAAEAAANDTDGEPSSGSLREYRERQAAAEDGDTEDVDGTPASLSEWRKTEDGKQAVKENEDRRPSLMDLLRAP